MAQLDDEETSERDLGQTFRDSSEMAGGVSTERAERFYDRMRDGIRRYLETKGAATGKVAEYLLLAPDFFVLLWRLINDARLNAKNKVMLGSGLAYYLFPLDIIPEGFVGAGGYIDDLVFAVYLLNRVLRDTDPEVLRQHWSGSTDVLDSIQNILAAADNLVGKEIFGRLKKGMR